VDVFLLWIYFVVFLYLVIRTLVRGFAKSIRKLKILGYCLNCIVAGATSVNVALEWHKMETDSSVGYAIIPIPPTYWWQKSTLGYKCLSRPDLEIAKSFLEKFPDQQIPVDSDGFVDRDTCIAKIKKKRWF
jgi:hypothetical protein